MRPVDGFSLFIVCLACGAMSHAMEPDPTIATISLPDGFVIERAASAPLVEHPVMAGFDDRGRLYVADNAGVNLAADELLKQLPSCIRVLEDVDGDGRFDRSTVFADKMTFPQGAAWYRGALYVASPPSIWRLEDTDGDGVADRRDQIVQKFGFIGNAADIHGCFVTPTGRIAWCDGRHGHEFRSTDAQAASKGLAARVFSCRPDGTGVEVFCGGGMDNPVEVAFTSEGDTIGTMTFYNPDEVRHDAVVHFVHGGVYPKKHVCTSEFKRTGELMPALSTYSATAPSGIMRYAGTGWGEEFRDNAFSAHFNTHKILRHVLTRQGATLTAADEDFLVSTDPDFHPTDVLQDADGSLLVIDTGGWFRIGCPASQVAKPEIGGAIYRIRRQGSKAPADPWGAAIAWNSLSQTELADLTEDPRPSVAERAIEMFAIGGEGGVSSLANPLFESTDYRARQNAVWALARNGSETARKLLRFALTDDDGRVRQAATHAISDLRDTESMSDVKIRLTDDDPATRREAAAALGRMGKADAVPALLAALEKPADRFEEHAIIYALIEINDRASTLPGLRHEVANVRRGSLIALDQMDSGNLTSELVAGLLNSDDTDLVRAVVDVLARHADWADSIAATLAAWLVLPEPGAEQVATVRGAVAALGRRPAVETLVRNALIAPRTAKGLRIALLEAIAGTEYESPPKALSEPLGKLLGAHDSDVARQAVLTVSALGLSDLSDQLLQVGLNPSAPRAVRLAALHSAADGKSRLAQPGFDFLVHQFDARTLPTDRLSAAETLGRFDLSRDQLASITRLIETCGPLELTPLLRAFESNDDATLGTALVRALEKNSAVEALPVTQLTEALKSFPASVQAAAAPLLSARGDDRQNTAKFESLRASIADGDPARGEQLFFGQRAACSSCHRIGARGEKIGPDLSKIGQIRSRGDILESIVVPSASLARGFESFQVVTNSGKVHSGILSRETTSAIYLRTTDRSEVRIPREEIDELAPGRTSIMPQGLERVLSPRELSDLVAFLEALK
jgi:putative membrane-bound dehydrogenase-like protein